MEEARYLFALPMTVQWPAVFCAGIIQVAVGAVLYVFAEIERPRNADALKIVFTCIGMLGAVQLATCLMHAWGVF